MVLSVMLVASAYCGMIITPPAKYRCHYRGTHIVRVVPDLICEGARSYGCTFPPTNRINRCVTFLDKATNAKCPILRVHENAHCCGWPANHPR